MSHTFEGPTARFHHNPDLSGEVMIVLKKADANGHTTLEVSGRDLLDFVAAYVAQQQEQEVIDKLQSRTTRQILGIPDRQSFLMSRKTA